MDARNAAPAGEPLVARALHRALSMRVYFRSAALLSLALSTPLGCTRRAPQPASAQAVAAPPAHAPGEGGRGHRRRREATLYVDGKPIVVLTPGELPSALHASGEEPRYRVVDLLSSVGVELGRVRELQLVGARRTDVLAVSGRELRSPDGAKLALRFGSAGEPGALAPSGLGRGAAPDALSAITVYIALKAPTLTPAEGLQLDGKPVVGIAYYGEALRGGVRVYQDERLALQIKKHLLQDVEPATTVDGLPAYRLLPLLQAHGIDVAKVAHGWVVADDKRTRTLSRAELGSALLAMGDQHKNELVIAGDKIPAQALELRTDAVERN